MTELDPAIASEFFACLPQISGACEPATLDLLSHVSKSYYKRMRENHAVMLVCKWAPYVGIHNLAMCYKEVYDYYRSVLGGHPIARWQGDSALQHNIDEGNADEILLGLEDRLLASNWWDFDVSKIDLRYYYLLRETAAERLSQLCSSKGLSLPPLCEFVGEQTYAFEFWLRSPKQAKRIFEAMKHNNTRTIEHAMMRQGLLSCLTSVTTCNLPIPTYMPLTMQELMTSEEMPRYTTEQEYGDMLVDWWLPRVYELNSIKSGIWLYYHDLMMLPSSVVGRLLHATDRSGVEHTLNLPDENYLRSSIVAVVEFLEVMLMLTSCSVRLRLDIYIGTTIHHLTAMILPICGEEDTIKFFEILWSVTRGCDKHKMLESLKRCMRDKKLHRDKTMEVIEKLHSSLSQ